MAGLRSGDHVWISIAHTLRVLTEMRVTEGEDEMSCRDAVGLFFSSSHFTNVTEVGQCAGIKHKVIYQSMIILNIRI